MIKINHDLTKVLTPKFANKWVAMNSIQTRVLISNKSAQKVLKEAKERGFKDAVITFVPEDYSGLIA